MNSLGNVTALNLVYKLERAFEIVVGGFYAYDDVGKLTTTTGLLLEHFAEFYRLSDGFLCRLPGGDPGCTLP